jgi:hypothetical protein
MPIVFAMSRSLRCGLRKSKPQFIKVRDPPPPGISAGFSPARAGSGTVEGTSAKEEAVSGESKTTTDHDELRRWVEERGGRPAAVKETGGDGDPGILRIGYPGVGDDDSLEEIPSDESFDAFERNQLAFVYQEETKEGEESRFSKLVSRSNGG